MLSGGSRPDSVLYVVWLAFDCEHECFCRPSTPERIKILYTNDIESVLDPLPAFWRSDMQHIGGIAKLATLIGKERATDQPTVLFDAGDIFTGALSKRTSGRLAIDLYGLMGYDAITLGNHEFEYGWQALLRVLPRAKYPVLNANIFFESGAPFARPYALIRRGQVSIGVIGLMGIDAFMNTMMPANREGLEIAPLESIAQDWIDELRNEVDLIVLLTHQGRTAPMQTDKERDAEVQRGIDEEYALAGALRGVDVLIAGHTDHGLDKPVRHPSTGTWIVQTYGQGMHLGILELERVGAHRGVLKRGGFRSLMLTNSSMMRALPSASLRLEAKIQTCSRLLVTFVSPLSGATTANRLWVRWWPMRSEKPHKQRSE